MFSTAHEFSFKRETKPHMTTCFNYANIMTLTLLYIIYQMLNLRLIVYSVISYPYLFSHWALVSSRLFSFKPLQVCASPHSRSWWIKSSFQNSRGLDSNILVYPLGVETCFQCYVIFLDLIYPFSGLRQPSFWFVVDQEFISSFSRFRQQ